ncbi:L-threonylcarbamoyladenylate synthase [Lusitaniella coriacea]|uniref:L-threonylcarbamoyladenylate synthase n=1 Tax=Lusitaniella coriacea TaxID=1983105 RepID=UPI003CF9D8E1
MATLFSIHPENPQNRSIEQITDALRRGAIMLYPTDTVYAIGCDLNVKSAVQRVRQLKQLSNDKPLTFLCSSLSNISKYAWVSDRAYRTMKRLIPGTYTFLLPATKLVPKLVMNPKRKTTGIRVPDRAVCHALLESLGNPIISTSASLPDESDDNGALPTLYLEKQHLFDALDPLVDIIIDDGSENNVRVSTIIDLTDEEPVVVRRGLGWEAVEDWMPLAEA